MVVEALNPHHGSRRHSTTSLLSHRSAKKKNYLSWLTTIQPKLFTLISSLLMTYITALKTFKVTWKTFMKMKKIHFESTFPRGLILQHCETGEYRYFNAYTNQTLLASPFKISNRLDLAKLIQLRQLHTSQHKIALSYGCYIK
jgi:hypothetical protein